MSYFQGQEAQGLRANQVALNALMSRGAWRQALGLLRSGLRPDGVSINTAMGLCSAECRWKRPTY